MSSNDDGAGAFGCGIILFGALGAVVGSCITEYTHNNRIAKNYRLQEPPATTIQLDVNGDGLEDIINPTGDILLQKKDGTFVEYDWDFVKNQTKIHCEEKNGKPNYNIRVGYDLE